MRSHGRDVRRVSVAGGRDDDLASTISNPSVPRHQLIMSFAPEKMARKPKTNWTTEKVNVLKKMRAESATNRMIATALDMTTRTIEKFIQKHESEEEGGEWKEFEPKKPGRRSETSEMRRDEIARLLDQDSVLTQNQIIDRLPVDLQCSRRTMGKELKLLAFSRKKVKEVPFERNTPETIKKRKIYANTILHKANRLLYFIDETGFNLHNGPKYGYSLKGTTPIVMHPGNRGQNCSVIACIGVNGVVEWEMRDGAFNAEALMNFLDKLLPLIGDTSSILIMDNAAFHKTIAVREKLASSSQRVEYLPPYSPQLNPIEEFFALLKLKQGEVRPRPKTRGQLAATIDEAMSQVVNRYLTCYYEHMRSFLRDAAHRRPFL